MGPRLAKRLRRRAILMAFSILRVGIINRLIRWPLKPLLPVLPGYFPTKFPVTGDVKLELPGAKSLILRSDGRDSIASRIYWTGLKGHEPETIRIYRRLLRRSRVVLDVGASTGLFALIAAIEGEGVEVHAFEPVPETFEFLVRNIAANRLCNVKAVRACVTNSDGEVALHLNYSPALPLTASVLEGYRESNRTIVVPALTLDNYVVENNIPTVDLLKIDAEGSDHQVLEGARQVLERHKPVVICEVLYRHTDKLLQAILDETEYRYFFIKDQRLLPSTEIVGDRDYKYRNYLFVPESKLAGLLDDLDIAVHRNGMEKPSC